MTACLSLRPTTWSQAVGFVSGSLLFLCLGCQSVPTISWKKKGEFPPVLPGASQPAEKAPLNIVEGKKEKPTPKMLVDFGFVQASMGNNSEAARLFEKALQGDKKNENAYVGLAKVKMALGHPDQAVEVLEGGLKKCPKSGAIYNEMGIAYSQLKRMPDSIAALEKAHQLDPSSELYLTNLAGMKAVTGNSEEAYRLYSRVMSAADAHVRLGEILAGQGQLEEGHGHFRAAIEAEPNHPKAIALLSKMQNPSIRPVDYQSAP